jgi:hypothetical protein
MPRWHLLRFRLRILAHPLEVLEVIEVGMGGLISVFSKKYNW